MADYRVSCDTDEYFKARRVAVVMIFIWPIGTPLCYLLLCWIHRHELSETKSRGDQAALPALLERVEACCKAKDEDSVGHLLFEACCKAKDEDSVGHLLFLTSGYAPHYN